MYLVKRSGVPGHDGGGAVVRLAATIRVPTLLVVLLLWSAVAGACSPATAVFQPSPGGAGHPAKNPWESATEAQLRAFRGAISTVRLRLPYGPRPGKDDNVLFTPTYPIYNATDRARMRAAYRSHGYTHWAIGPISHPRKLYHDQYPPAPFDSILTPDAYANRLEELWRTGFIPVYFALPDTPDFMNQDGWNWKAVEQELTPVYRSPRWQSLVRIVVLAWEPDVPAVEWLRAVQWLARVFPHALRYIHLPADHTAPCRSSDLVINGGAIANEAASWRTVEPYIHGLLYQSGAMANRGATTNGRTPIQQFLHDLWDIRRHLHDGVDNWPTASATPDRPLDVVAFEYASYWSYWNNVPEAEARSWGDAAMGNGGPTVDPVTHQKIDLYGKLAGYGDGGTQIQQHHTIAAQSVGNAPGRMWQASLPADGAFTILAAGFGKLAILSHSVAHPNLVTAFDVKSGRVVWSKEILWGVVTFAADDNRLYLELQAPNFTSDVFDTLETVSNITNEVVTFRWSDGRIGWHAPFKMMGIELAWNGHLLLSGHDDKSAPYSSLISLDAANGREQWRRERDEVNGLFPVRDKLYAYDEARDSEGEYLHVIDPATGVNSQTMLFNPGFAPLTHVTSLALLPQSNILIGAIANDRTPGSNGHWIRAVSGDGKPAWERGYAGRFEVVDNVLICQSYNSHLDWQERGLIGLEPTTGYELWHRPDMVDAFAGTDVNIGDWRGHAVVLLEDKICGLEPHTGKTLWTINLLPLQQARITRQARIIGDTIVIATSGTKDRHADVSAYGRSLGK